MPVRLKVFEGKGIIQFAIYWYRNHWTFRRYRYAGILVGLGYFDKNGFNLVQYIIQCDPTEEASMLLEISNFIEKFSGFVSFNGKAFDIPLLEPDMWWTYSIPFEDLLILFAIPGA